MVETNSSAKNLLQENKAAVHGKEYSDFFEIFALWFCPGYRSVTEKLVFGVGRTVQ